MLIGRPFTWGGHGNEQNENIENYENEVVLVFRSSSPMRLLLKK